MQHSSFALYVTAMPSQGCSRFVVLHVIIRRVLVLTIGLVPTLLDGCQRVWAGMIGKQGTLNEIPSKRSLMFASI